MLSYYEQLENEEKILVNAEMQNEGKSPLIAYLLWFFLGTWGAHNFYLGRKGVAIAQLILGIIGWITTLLLVGFFILAIVGIWAFIDVFLISSYIKKSAKESRELKAQRILALRQTPTQ